MGMYHFGEKQCGAFISSQFNGLYLVAAKACMGKENAPQIKEK